MCRSTCSSCVRTTSTPCRVGESAISRIAVAEASIASRVRRSESARSSRWSSSRAVRTASAWNRSSEDVMSDRIAWSRDRSVTIRSCSGRTSLRGGPPNLGGDLSHQPGRLRPRSPGCPPPARSSTARCNELRQPGLGSASSRARPGKARDGAKSPRRKRPGSSGSRVGPARVIATPRLVGPRVVVVRRSIGPRTGGLTYRRWGNAAAVRGVAATSGPGLYWGARGPDLGGPASEGA